jgi:steroid 5-alpha reductase family enzyme
MWLGLAIASTSALRASKGALPPWFAGLAFLSPLLEYLLITKVSGVPMLEKSGDEKFGNDPAYQKYKKEVRMFDHLPVFVSIMTAVARPPSFGPSCSERFRL